MSPIRQKKNSQEKKIWKGNLPIILTISSQTTPEPDFMKQTSKVQTYLP